MESTSKEDIYVWDNFFEQEVFDDLIHKSEFVPWKYCEVVSESQGNPVERFMTWNIYEEGHVDFDPMNLKGIIDNTCRTRILEKLPKADIADMKRLRFNGTMKGEGYVMWPHADIFGEQPSVHTIVVYLQGDGGTTIYEHKNGPELLTVDFKPNRAVMFPSQCWHRAESPKNSYFRTSLGIVYMFDA